MSIAGGLHLAVERAVEADSNVLQIFVKNSNRWAGSELAEDVAARFCDARAGAGLYSVVAHSSYLINMATPAEELWLRSIDAFIDEMARSDRLEVDYLVLHPGAHMQSGEAEGVRRVAAALDRVHERTAGFHVQVALETTAGQGTSVGCRFEHLRDIIAAVSQPERVNVCFDTCHVFAAGYDVRSEDAYGTTIETFDEVVGLEKLKVFHFNDSKKELGSRVDRHDHIGEGKIGLDGFRWFMNDERFSKIPKILETPKGDDGELDKKNLEVLRSLLRS